jgi:UDP-glucuronate 4-epimerase
MAHAYSSLYKIKTIGLRFFTVYGPWGRPDMSLFLFTKKILNNQKIEVFNRGIHMRDFTYIDDIINGIYLCAKKLTKKSSNKKMFEVVNVARGQSVKLKDFISIIEKKLKKKAKKRYKVIQKGDVVETAGSIKKIKSNFGYKPIVSIDKGVENFIDWYKKFYKK